MVGRTYGWVGGWVDKLIDVLLIYRNIGVGTSSAVGRIGSMAAPYVIWLVRFKLRPDSLFTKCTDVYTQLV